MKKLVSTFISVVLGLTTASSMTLAQSASPAGSDQQTNPLNARVRIFINDHLLTENVIEITPAAPSPLPIPYPKRKESDPIPFPLTGEIYILVLDLTAVINGHNTVESPLKLEGDKLYARKHIAQARYEDFLTVNSDGLISSALREFKGEDGEQKTYLPLNDLVKALGGTLKADKATRAYVITVSPGTTSLLSLVQK